MQRIFITRSLKENSPFLNALAGYAFHVEGHSLIHFTAIPFKQIPETDWIFFYSQKAVAFFLQRVKEIELVLTPGLKWGVIGSATSKALEHHGIHPDFIGSGEPNISARHFLPLAKGQRVLFPRAAQSRRSVQQILSTRIEVYDLIVYKNTIDKKVRRPEADILIFTSPLNAQAYFECRQPSEKVKIIAIGPTTASALQRLGAKNIITAQEPSEKGLAKAVVIEIDNDFY